MTDEINEAKQFEDQINENYMYLGWEQSSAYNNPLEILIEIELIIEINGEEI